MIRFVHKFGYDIWVNPKYIVLAQPYDDDTSRTEITVNTGASFVVRHELQDVIRMLREGTR